MERHAVTHACRLEAASEKQAIAVAAKNVLAIISAHGDVGGDAGSEKAWKAGHVANNDFNAGWNTTSANWSLTPILIRGLPNTGV
jgi:hypothetical protein